jgi:hypothetical protein
MVDLKKISSNYYVCEHGHFEYQKKENYWVFIPKEKPLTRFDLLNILNEINNLNELC